MSNRLEKFERARASLWRNHMIPVDAYEFYWTRSAVLLFGSLPTRRHSALAATLIALLAVSGCGIRPVTVDNVGARSAPTGLAFVSLGPGSPGVLSVVESQYANATRQTIALATYGKTPGENQMRADVIGLTNEGVNPEAKLADRALNEVDLYSEAQEALPNIPLRISLNYMQNRLGPFGYAVGRSMQGDTCIFAWQRVATPDQNLSLVNSRVALSVRLRLCDPRASEAQLAATMMNLSVNTRMSGGRATPEPKDTSADVGVAGVPLAPASIMASAASPLPAPAPSPPTPRHPRHASARRQMAPAPAAPAIQPPEASGGAVPSPPVSSNPLPAVVGAGPAVPPPPVEASTPSKDMRR